MDLALQWLLTLAGLAAGLFIKRICQRFRLPQFPWRLPWIALLAATTSQSIQSLDLAITTEIDVSIFVGILASIAVSRSLVWIILELLPKLKLLPSSPKILRDLIFIIGSILLITLKLKEEASIDLVGLITTSAVLTAVLGLAAQDPLKDLIGGLSLQLEHVIREGDWVEIDGEFGRVQSISWRDTELSSLYGSKLIFPHAHSNSSTIKNFTSNGPYGNRIIVSLDYNMPPHIAKRLMQRISDNHPLVLNSPASIVRINSYAESAINYEWVNWQNNCGQNRQLRGDLQEQLWYALKREGFSFPFSIRDVRLTKNTQPTETISPHKATLLKEAAQLLQENQLFSILSEQQISKMVALSQIDSYGPGETIACENETGNSLFLLINGEVSIRKKATLDYENEVAQLRRGDIAGEMTVFTGTPRSATIQSICNVDLLEVNREAIAELIEEEPILIERFSQLIRDRQTQLENLKVKASSTHVDVVSRMKELFHNLLSQSHQ